MINVLCVHQAIITRVDLVFLRVQPVSFWMELVIHVYLVNLVVLIRSEPPFALVLQMRSATSHYPNALR